MVNTRQRMRSIFNAEIAGIAGSDEWHARRGWVERTRHCKRYKEGIAIRRFSASAIPAIPALINPALPALPAILNRR